MSTPDTTDQNFKLGEPGAVVRARVSRPLASFQAMVVDGAWGGGVIEAVVSNDGIVYDAHPDVIELSADGASAPFNVAAYAWFGARVKTASSTAATVAHVFLRQQGR